MMQLDGLPVILTRTQSQAVISVRYAFAGGKEKLPSNATLQSNPSQTSVPGIAKLQNHSALPELESQRQQTESPLTLGDFPPDLLGLIFENLYVTERYRVIPLVCKHWREVHLEQPPTALIESLPMPAAVLARLKRAGHGIGEMVFKLRKGYEGGLDAVLQALEYTPNLQRLSMGRQSTERLDEVEDMIYDSPHLRSTMFRFQQLKVLHLSIWSIGERNNLEACQLSYLGQLEELILEQLHVDGLRRAEFFWEVVASMDMLRRVEVNTLVEDISLKAAPTFKTSPARSTTPSFNAQIFGRSVGHCAQLEYLHLPSLQSWRQLEPISHLAKLTQLKGLTLRTPTPCASFAYFMEWPLLEHLDITLDLGHEPPAPVVGSQPLTRLCLRANDQGGGMCNLADILPPTAEALASIKHLELHLEGFGRHHIPQVVLQALPMESHVHIVDHSGSHIPVYPASLAVADRFASMERSQATQDCTSSGSYQMDGIEGQEYGQEWGTRSTFRGQYQEGLGISLSGWAGPKEGKDMDAGIRKERKQLTEEHGKQWQHEKWDVLETGETTANYKRRKKALGDKNLMQLEPEGFRDTSVNGKTLDM